ncbi:Aste57867_9988 [Aphanomyces stellatus]|uniref:Aste57867_9988 protein n=1 Tax=Aphanomyces stellatus TaxID=120398 RepID=A0A485KPV0_9STRA|nr:hypothetical protein As57867_009949 [Aphanomyces stellatus]VFT86866.1 Aste57867_9988 [Aphanomyces stellatus]
MQVLVQVVQTTELCAKITSFQEGWPQDLLPFTKLTKPRYFVREFEQDTLFDTTIAHNHSILSPWLATHGIVGLPRLFHSMKRMVDIVLLDAVAHGNMVILAYLHEMLDLLSFDDRLIDLAAHFGQLQTVQYLHRLGHPGCTKMAINEAAVYGHLSVIQWLCVFRDEGFSDAAFFGATRNGHMSVLDWLHKKDGGCVYRLRYDDNLRRLWVRWRLLSETVAKGHWNVLNWLRVHGPAGLLPLLDVVEGAAAGEHDKVMSLVTSDSQARRPFNAESLAFDTAVMCGNLSLAKRLSMTKTFRIDHAHIAIAAACGHLDMMQWWSATYGAALRPMNYESNVTFVRLFQGPHHAVVEWFLVSLPQNVVVSALCILESFQLTALLSQFPHLGPLFESWKAQSAAFASRVGDLAALARHDDAEMDMAMEAAASAGHLPLVKYLHQERHVMCAIGHGAMSGRLDVVQYLHASGGMDLSHYVRSCHVLGYTDILAYLATMAHAQGWSPLEALTHGFLADAKVLTPTCQDGRTCVSITWQRICALGNVRLMEFFLRHNRVDPSDVYEGQALTSMPILRYLLAAMPPEDVHALLMDTVIMGNFPSFRYVFDQFPTACTVAVMDKAASRGHFEMLKFLHQDPRCPGCTTAAMDNAARNGHLHIVQWLHQNRSEGCTATAMTAAAKRGNLKMVQWLAEHQSEGRYEDALACATDVRVQAYLRNLIHFGGPQGLAKAKAMASAAEPNPPYRTTIDTSDSWTLVSISAMQVYNDMSAEELRWHHYLNRPISNSDANGQLTFCTMENAIAMSNMPEKMAKSVEELRWEDYQKQAML